MADSNVSLVFSANEESWNDTFAFELLSIVLLGLDASYFVLSLLFNAISIVRILNNGKLHNGYFMVFIVFLVIQVLFFLLSVIGRVTLWYHFQLLGPQIADFRDVFNEIFPLMSSTIIQFSPVVAVCLLGTDLLLLTSLTFDRCASNRVESSRCRMALRTTLVILAFLIGIGVLAAQVIYFFFPYLITNDELLVLWLFHATYAIPFGLIPVICIAIAGACNCVNDKHSTREYTYATVYANRLNFKVSTVGAIISLMFLVYCVSNLAYQVWYPDLQIWFFAHLVAEGVFHTLFFLISLISLCSLCCCN